MSYPITGLYKEKNSFYRISDSISMPNRGITKNDSEEIIMVDEHVRTLCKIKKPKIKRKSK